ncbi:hypothetical protein [Actinokineospora cianjurensis]|uniref:hypothetical protein n=1 Tax=Actinokineospora cianjurensis TaxID=585224 RepID=UPI0011C3D324|nr:hypothetical protein [Actinokineospora cianjurensis]
MFRERGRRWSLAPGDVRVWIWLSDGSPMGQVLRLQYLKLRLTDGRVIRLRKRLVSRRRLKARKTKQALADFFGSA